MERAVDAVYFLKVSVTLFQDVLLEGFCGWKVVGVETVECHRQG